MIKGACIGDKAIVKVYDTVREGTITMISEKGINIKNETGVHFLKWCHVKKIESKLLNKIKKYKEALQFYADMEHIDATYLGSGCYDFHDIETGETARIALEEDIHE